MKMVQQSIEETLVQEKQVLENKEVPLQNEIVDSLSKPAKIVFSLVPIVALILSSISPLIIYRQKRFENLSQVDKSASKVNEIDGYETSRIIEHESFFTGSKFVVLV